MNQLILPWGDVVTEASSKPDASDRSPIRAKPNIPKSGERCRTAAAALEKHVTAKHESANRMLALPPTRKRLQDASGIRQEAIRLARIQRTLLKLAEMHEQGIILPELAPLVTRASVERALFTEAGNSAIHRIFAETECSESGPELVLRLEREAMLMKIPGFLPTPPEVATDLVAFAGLREASIRILEPSAGSGSLIDAVGEKCHGSEVSYCEVNCLLLDLLRAKYERSKSVHFIGRDFLDLDPAHFPGRFDGILMNPPFQNREDIEHVSHAFKFLAPGGVLAAILSEGSFSRSDKKSSNFREFLGARNAQIRSLPAGSFAKSGTQVSSRMIRLVADS